MSGPRGWMKAKNPGQPAKYPIRAGTKVDWQGVEVTAVFDAENDEVYGGVWGDTHTVSPIPPGTPPIEGTVLEAIQEFRNEFQIFAQEMRNKSLAPSQRPFTGMTPKIGQPKRRR